MTKPSTSKKKQALDYFKAYRSKFEENLNNLLKGVKLEHGRIGIRIGDKGELGTIMYNIKTKKWDELEIDYQHPVYSSEIETRVYKLPKDL